jgi:hypothetical protein
MSSGSGSLGGAWERGFYRKLYLRSRLGTESHAEQKWKQQNLAVTDIARLRAINAEPGPDRNVRFAYLTTITPSPSIYTVFTVFNPS